MLYKHVVRSVRSYRKKPMDTFKMFGKIPIPKHLDNWQESCNFALMCCLLVIVSTEPILYCMQDNHGIFLTNNCTSANKVKLFPYSVFCAFAMFLYYVLLIDFAV